jgi:hypothetical protein
MLFRIIILLLVSFVSFGQNLGTYENIGFYGGYTWDFHISITGGKRLITTAQSGGNQIYFVQVQGIPDPEKFSWRKLPATNLSKTSDIEANHIDYHKASAKLFIKQGFNRILKAGLEDNYASPEDGFNDYIIRGDTLISIFKYCNGKSYLKRHFIEQDGSLREISKDTFSSGFRSDLYLDKKSGKVFLIGEEESFISQEPYYSSSPSLNLKVQSLNFPTDSLYTDKLFHIDQKGVWWALQSQNFHFNFLPNDEPQVPLYRLLFRSEDEGLNWTVETINEPWQLAFMMPPNISTAIKDNQKMIFLAGSLYRIEGENWKKIGRLYNPNNIFIYNGTSLIDPIDPSIAYHSSNLGPAMSTHYGDSLFLLNKGLDAAMLRDLNYYPKSRTMVLSSVQKIGILRAVGLPQEEWSWLNLPDKKAYRSYQVAFDEEDNLVYFAADKLYKIDLDGGNWQILLDPDSILNVPINKYDQLEDIAIHPNNPAIIALAANSGGYKNSFILLTRNSGHTWDSLPMPGRSVVARHLDWRKAGNGAYKLYLNMRKSYSSSLEGQLPYYYLDKSDSIQLLYEDFSEFKSGEMIALLKSERDSTIPHLAITDFSYRQGSGEAQLAIKHRKQEWDTISGPTPPECFICYSYPRALTANKDYAFMSFGHLLYAFDIRPGQERLIGEVSSLPRLENILQLEIIDNYLYTLGIYGLYRQEIEGLSKNPSPTELWALYPNPSEGILNVQPPTKIQIYDLKGGLLYESSQIEFQIDLSYFQPGLYLVKHPKSSAELWRKL